MLPAVRGWMESLGPVTAASLAETLAFPRDEIESALLKLESEGQVMRGRFSPRSAGRRNRMVQSAHSGAHPSAHAGPASPRNRACHGRAIPALPVSLAALVPGSRLHGVDGTLQIIKQLQGYEISAAAWEPEVLARRVARYEPEFLDQLCLAGEVMWARLSPHPAFEDPEPRRVRPTRTAPIAIFLRESADWLASLDPSRKRQRFSHPAREVLTQLEQRGASFFADLVRATGRLASEVEDGLWELVAAGLVTADGFENLRSLVDPKRRRGEGRGRLARPRHAAGPLGAGASRGQLGNGRGPCRRLRRSIAGALGCHFPRSAGARNVGAALARSAACIAPQRSARRNPRRPIRLRLQRRTVRAPRSARPAASRPPLDSRDEQPNFQCRSVESGRYHLAGPAREHAVARRS